MWNNICRKTKPVKDILEGEDLEKLAEFEA
jgi:hypothetical protein